MPSPVPGTAVRHGVRHTLPRERFATPARWSRPSSPSRARSPRTRAISSRWSTSRCPSSPPRRPRWRPAPRSSTRSWATTSPPTSSSASGNPERAFAAADHTLRETFRVMRGGSHSMEGRGVVARYDEALDAFTVWDATQAPHAIRAMLAYLFELPEHRVRVIAPPDVGGGLGPKASFYPEEALVCWLARAPAPAGQVDRGPARALRLRRPGARAGPHGRDRLHERRHAARRCATSSPTISACTARWSRRSSPPARCPVPTASRTSTPRSARPTPTCSRAEPCAAPAGRRACW